MKFIITRPQHDVTTKYISSWAEEIIIFARKKGIEVIDLFRDKANRKELEGRIKKLFPHLIFFNGHGSQNTITGHDNEILIKAEENHSLLEGKMTYALSCDSGKILGPKVALNKSTTYIGYADEFIFVCDKKYLTKPLEDPLATPFRKASNQVIISLLKGHTAKEASERSKAIFREYYIKLSSSSSDQDSLQVAQFLWWNMRHQVCLGDVDSKI